MIAGFKRSDMLADFDCFKNLMCGTPARSWQVSANARQIQGVRTKDVAAKLQRLSLSQLPSVERAKLLMTQRAAALRDAAREKRKKDGAADEAREKLLQAQRSRKLAVDLQWQKIMIRQMHERKVMLTWFLAEQKRQLGRRQWQATGLALYLKKVAALRAIISHFGKQRRKHLRTMAEFHRQVAGAMRRRHEHEAAECERFYALRPHLSIAACGRYLDFAFS